MQQNKWVGLLDRSADQILESIKQRLKNNVSEMDLSDTDGDLMRILDIFAHNLEVLHYYLDRKAEELFLSTAKKFSSAAKFAKFADYRIKSSSPATADVVFFFNNPTTALVLIPEGTNVQTKSGVVFRTTEAASIAVGETEVTVPAKQHERQPFAPIGESNGAAAQVFVMEDNITEQDMIITVGGEAYALVETFAFSKETYNHCLMTRNESNLPVLVFGNGQFGRIPPIGTIEAQYYTTRGASGNVAANTITEINTSLVVPSGFVLQVTNRQKASGGSDPETLIDLKNNIPLHFRTNRRAITKQDFIDLAELVPGVAKAGALQDSYKKVQLYIVPKDGGVASQAILDDVATYLDDKRAILTEVEVQRAGQVRILLQGEVEILSTFPRTPTLALLKREIASKYSSQRQQISGKVFLSDIYELIETRKGVIRSNILTLTPVPYAMPRLPNEKPLNWQVELLDGATGTIAYRLLFTSPTQFQLFRSGLFLGNFTVGQEIVQPEVRFTISAGGYEAGDRWDFKTYKFFGNVELDEPSVPIILESDINISIVGGF